MEGEEIEKEEEDVKPGVEETEEEARSIKLGQGVIDLPVAEATGSRKSLTGSKKSSNLGSVKAESVHSDKGKNLPGVGNDFIFSWKRFM